MEWFSEKCPAYPSDNHVQIMGVSTTLYTCTNIYRCVSEEVAEHRTEGDAGSPEATYRPTARHGEALTLWSIRGPFKTGFLGWC